MVVALETINTVGVEEETVEFWDEAVVTVVTLSEYQEQEEVENIVIHTEITPISARNARPRF